MNPSKEKFFLKVAHALAGCQLVEEALKYHISQEEHYTPQKLQEKVQDENFKKKYQKFSKGELALGGLIYLFNELCDDINLAVDLCKFKDKRNELSHRGITKCLDPDEELDYSSMSEYQRELDSIEPEARELYIRVLQKSQIFGFENLDKPS